MKKKLCVAKFGGSLLDADGKGIPKIVNCIKALRNKDSVGPIVVFSAPTGCTDDLIRIGESYAQSSEVPVSPIFENYRHIAGLYLKDSLLQLALDDLIQHKERTQEALRKVNKRFSGNIKAKVLATGGELATSALMNHILLGKGIDSVFISNIKWPVVTDDNFEEATPLFEASKANLKTLLEPLEAGKVCCLAGFLGITVDGLETILGRGGSDLTDVFVSCLLKKDYQTETLLFKDVPVQSADPKVVRGQKTVAVEALTYNEAHKASMMGMKIVQGPAIAMARRCMQPLKVVPIDEPEKFSVIQGETSGVQIVKCLTGKDGCAILSMKDEKSRSFEDALKIWERRNDFIDLGAETLETGEQIRDFLFLDSEFLRKNEQRLKGFDDNMKIEYGLGVVTLIGDRMRDSPGVASLAMSAIHGINIKRGILAPHTSQIIIVVNEENVNAAVRAIHSKMTEMNQLPS